jgi:hypothetical protein
MTSRLNKLAIALALNYAFGTTSFAQQVVTTTVGIPAKFDIESKVVSAEMKQCSIVVTQPNGSVEVVILQAPNFKTALSNTPTVQGTTVVSWKGEYTLNGKIDNQVVGGVKQLFSNIGELVTLSKMTQGTMPCPGNGTITIVAIPSVQPIAAPKVAPAATPPIASAPAPAPAPAPARAPSRFRSTANIPTVMNQPIESSAFKAKYNNDSTYRTMVDDFNVNRSKQSLTALRLYSELGDANAQFLYGLAHLEDWTGLNDIKRACYWIRESAVQGLSQARLVLANKAVYNKECFDVPPTLDEAKTWAQLASMSNERAVKENAEKLLQDILRIQITNQR